MPMTKEEEGSVETAPGAGSEAADAGAGEVPETGRVDEKDLPHAELLLTLQDARERADAHWNEVLRARAELANMQRRMEREVENAHKYALDKFVNELIPVVDSLELGIEAAAKGAGEAAGQLCEGMELTLKMFLTALGKFGVRQVNPQGERFDPALHQAMAAQPVPNMEPNHVVAVYQKGYTLNDRLVRPAMVVVSAPGSGGGQQGSSGQNGDSAPRIDEMA
jgi:molecular chaperone GrpE